MVTDQKNLMRCVRWLEEHIGCEIYFIHHEEKTNGFVEYKNGGHVIYVIGNQDKVPVINFLEILAHEAGHVLYNKRKMSEGIDYACIVQKTQNKLKCFDHLLKEELITNEEYERFYQAMEEEWESDQEKVKLLKRLQEELRVY
ncbi:hypothetical protein [Ammoniphilus sp. CFH 90114]|uniref:hypothetical protein n=1 Tax=Ammoniphilus sp. CFH 90114 TaxID=2493665 RepID=UPI001027BC79|nr:hypothetical protein [Ammoniphilus sp. CFH 90114]RXT07246.1 hypothetical protein EIZ39_13975 [Ammoniphilus sp. CFH 90114]